MTGREWQPGDVALVRSMYGTEVVGVRTGTPCNMGWAYSMDLSDGPGPGGSGSTRTWSSDADGELAIRPLVMIDPEDREQVERLTAALFSEIGGDWPDGHTANEVQAALREFASPTPPKPDEPTGLGAVVEAIYNNHFVRAQSGDAPWVRVADDGDARSCSWGEIAVVRVLSPGVEAGETSC